MSAAEHVAHALEGRQSGWDALVDTYGGLVWSVIRGFRLGAADSQDVFQTCWLKLVERLDTIRNPEAVGGWLATTARHECLRVIRASGRTVVVDTVDLERVDDEAPPLEAGLLDAERDRDVWSAFARLGDRCQALLRLLVADPAPSYEEIGAALDMPIGSIGPTRARCLEQLRRKLSLPDLADR